MLLKHDYWYFPSAIPSEKCDQIVLKCLKQKSKKAITGTESKKLKSKSKLNKKDLLDLKKTRNSNIVWINDVAVKNMIEPYVNSANTNSGWNFEVDQAESIQFTHYGKNQHYDWHFDCWDTPYSNGRIRKLSAIVLLSDPKSYKGGDLEFQLFNRNTGEVKIIKCNEIRSKGSVVVFPSFLRHRVTPVTKGFRNSLVMWITGFPFK
jgi:PKHD-type hydroxylase|tara:strand:+ start:351 stop:968 length:618 start_codon:yes stop_codon:yes gene_type:complete